MASQFFTPSPTATSSGGDVVYVAAVPLKAAAGPPQLIMSMAYSLNLSNLQHFMVLIKPSSPIRQEVIVFDFQPRNPESIEAAVSVLSGSLIPGSDSQTVISNVICDSDSFSPNFNESFLIMEELCVVLQRRLKNVPRQRCWMVGSSKGNAMEMAIEVNNSWETDLRVGFHDCRHYTNELVQNLTGEIQILERLPRS